MSTTTGRPAALSVAARDPQTVPEPLFHKGWDAACVAQAPARLRVISRDRRWHTTWVVAERQGAVVGVLPVHRDRGAAPPAAFYDPRSFAPALAGRLAAGPSGWCYVGGIKDLVSGATLARGLAEDDRQAIRRALVVEAFAEAERHGATAIAPYVRDREVTAFREALGPCAATVQVAADAVLDLAGPDLESYLAGLSKKARYRVRREWQERDSRGLRAAEEPAAALCDEAAELVVAVKRRHDVPDHPRMAALRLREWSASGGDDHSAFTVRAADGSLLGAAFVARFQGTVEVNELGLRDEMADRHLVYTELLVHAPVRYALRHGCRRLALGLDSTEPKSLRGARIAPVWTVACPPGPPR